MWLVEKNGTNNFFSKLKNQTQVNKTSIWEVSLQYAINRKKNETCFQSAFDKQFCVVDGDLLLEFRYLPNLSDVLLKDWRGKNETSKLFDILLANIDVIIFVTFQMIQLQSLIGNEKPQIF